MFSDRRLRLRYRHGRDRSVRTYTLDPYGLVNKAGVWYLVADHRGQPRLFRAGPAPPAAAPSDQDEGWTQVELRFRALLAAQPLLAFGPDVEILAPDELRQTLPARPRPPPPSTPNGGVSPRGSGGLTPPRQHRLAKSAWL